MGTIVTFYSYKGGVGRSMALANVAVLLARRAKRVLAVDWDLEAPGLDRYFAPLLDKSGGPGLLRLILDASGGKSPDYRDYLWKVTENVPGAADLAFLPSGRESDADYARTLDQFDWRAFFSKRGGGTFIEGLREAWRADFDIVLIDSRTGLTDSGGICTIQLPDIVVPVFTANYQSLYGVRDVLRLAQKARQALAYDRMPLTIFPLPARFSSRAEFQVAQEWILRFEEVLREFYRDWLPKWARPSYVLERVKVPQVDYFGFGEKLAVLEQGVNDPEGMGYVYNRVAELLSSDFSDIESWLGPEARAEARRGDEGRAIISSEVSGASAASYQFDVYVSYSYNPQTINWLSEFVHMLTSWVEVITGSKLSVFLDIAEIRLGDEWASRQMAALSRSKMLLAVTTPHYFQSEWCLREWSAFKARSETTGVPLIVPVWLGGGYRPPKELETIQYVDLSEFEIKGSELKATPAYLRFQESVRDVAGRVGRLLTEALAPQSPGADGDLPAPELNTS